MKGNCGTVPGTNFFGTTDLQALALATNGKERLRIGSYGKVGIGTTFPTNQLDLNLGPAAPVDTGMTIRGSTSS